ncbi:MAG: hypothetical protein COX49_03895 [bacterium (Candidatus Stahlbacteria) CG23_combo_of_CG06-09_8_20_14_all_40_9]|nr:MAG: hypothetical protein COX49_03895 [bacterium (Candidatus Stahlbacteria) CG23_combo_of_CG06-09_8_20_14_all_40_9]
MGRYVYGIIGDSEAKSFGPIGIDGEEVYTISPANPSRDGTGREGGIACLVSNSPVFDYRSMPKPNVATHLSIYQSAIEQVMKDYTVIPVKFGTIAKDEDEVREILLKGYQELIEILKSMDNKIEFDVVALWSDFDSILKEVGKAEEIKELKMKYVGAYRNTPLQDRIEIGRTIKVLLDKRNNVTLELIQNVLNEIAVDACNHERLNDKMIMNNAFLIERDKEPQFDKLIDEIDNRLQGKVNFRCVGPLPPYSFSRVEVERIGEEALNKGMSVLGLDTDASLTDIKNAYRTLARRYHPDMLRQEGIKADELFNELTQAYELLLNYRKGVEKGKFSKNSIIIKL